HVCYFNNFLLNTTHFSIFSLSLHDALPIYEKGALPETCSKRFENNATAIGSRFDESVIFLFIRFAYHPFHAYRVILLSSVNNLRSEEHTSELQSRENLVCRLLLEKNKK